jgi:hypothetical protein
MAGSFGVGGTPPSRNQGGIIGPGGTNVNPTYKQQGPSIASKIKKIFEDKPKYTSEQIVANKKLQAEIDAAKKKRR